MQNMQNKQQSLRLTNMVVSLYHKCTYFWRFIVCKSLAVSESYYSKNKHALELESLFSR